MSNDQPKPITVEPIDDESEEPAAESDQLPKPALAGFAIGLIPLAYLGYPFAGLIVGGFLGGVGYVAAQYPAQTREWLSRS